jgi:hypothetical protein
MATVSLAFPGCQPQSSSAHERIVSPRGAEVSFCSSQPVGCVPGTVFSVRDTQALAVETSIEQIAPGDHMQSLEIMMPDGRRYEETKVAFRVPENSNAPVPGVRMVPIAGTWIQTRQVTGIWKVRYSLDGKLLATSDFRLEP